MKNMLRTVYFKRCLTSLGKTPICPLRKLSSGASDAIIDMRSDTVTKPSKDMFVAMSAAEIGDDVFEEDPSIKRLEGTLAEMLGFEAALFTPTATMSNLVAIGAHTSHSRLNEIICGDKSHIFIYECGGASAFMGCSFNTVPNERDGSLNMDAVRSAIRDLSDIHQPKTRLICIENTHNKAGGTILPEAFVSNLNSFASGLDIPVHVDGSRLFNAAAARNVDASSLVHGTSSVTICLSKGLGCPLGSVLVGSKPFIQRARSLRKGLGGGMRQAGVIAAAGLYALETNAKNLHLDNAKADYLASRLRAVPGLSINHDVETNILFFNVANRQAADLQTMCKHDGVLFGAYDAETCRAVGHLDVTDDDVVRVADVIERNMEKLNNGMDTTHIVDGQVGAYSQKM